MRPMPSGARSRITTSTVDGSVLRSDASATHGEFSNARRHSARSTARTLRPRRLCEHREHLAVRQPMIPSHVDLIDVKHLEPGDNGNRAMAGIQRKAEDD